MDRYQESGRFRTTRMVSSPLFTDLNGLQTEHTDMLLLSIRMIIVQLLPLQRHFEGLVVWLASRPDGIAFFNHPGNENTSGLEFNHFTTTPSDQIVGIDLFNRGDGFSNYYYNDGYYYR